MPSSEQIAQILEKCADFIDNVSKREQAMEQQHRMIVKTSQEREQQEVSNKAASIKEVLASLLDRDIDDKEALEFAQSDLGTELLSKVSMSASPNDLGVIDGTEKKATHPRGDHWGSFVTNLNDLG